MMLGLQEKENQNQMMTFSRNKIPIIFHRMTKHDGDYTKEIFMLGYISGANKEQLDTLIALDLVVDDCFLIQGVNEIQSGINNVMMQDVRGLQLFEEVNKLDRKIRELMDKREALGKKLLQKLEDEHDKVLDFINNEQSQLF